LFIYKLAKADSSDAIQIIDNAEAVAVPVALIEIFDQVARIHMTFRTKTDLTTFDQRTILYFATHARRQFLTIVPATAWTGIFTSTVPLAKSAIETTWSD
jgi:hypothetical protein